jgi:hypothetical protein
MIGQVLGYSRVEEKIGTGGMGDVYPRDLNHGGPVRESHALNEIVPARV